MQQNNLGMTIIEVIVEATKTAKEKGWDDDGPAPVGDFIANTQAELSEAWEDYRLTGTSGVACVTVDDSGKPQGLLTELADVLIRIGHFVGSRHLGMEFLDALKLKLEYNKTRPHRHGGKFA